MDKKIVATIVLLAMMAGTALAETSKEEVIAPLTKLKDLVFLGVNVVAFIAIGVAAAMYLFSGSNLQARENAKGMLTYAIIGMMIVNAAPAIAGYFGVTGV